MQKHTSKQILVQKTLPGGYTILKDLGTSGGCFNQGMYMVQHASTSRPLICKSLTANTSSNHEVPALRRLQSFPHILQLIDFVPATTSIHDFSSLPKTMIEDDGTCLSKLIDFEIVACMNRDDFRKERMDHIYLEYCDLGTLEDVAEKHRRQGVRIPETFLWHVFLSMAKALEVCSTGLGTKDRIPICHGDVTAGNILLTSPNVQKREEFPRVVLADFGCAFETEAWMRDDFEFKVTNDVQCLGRVMGEVACSLPTMEEILLRNPKMLRMPHKKRLRELERMSLENLGFYSREFRTLLEACAKVDPEAKVASSPSPTELVGLIEALRRKVVFKEHDGRLLI